MSVLRTLTGALVVSLLLVPALARAGQPLDAGRNSAPVSNFSRSANVPPDPVVIVPDSSLNPIGRQVLLQPLVRLVPAIDDVLPPAPSLADAESLRAPPRRPLA